MSYTGNEDAAAKAVKAIADYAATASRSREIDPFAAKNLSYIELAAWEVLKSDGHVFGILQILSRTDPSKIPSRRPTEGAAAFLIRMKRFAEICIDVWDSGIRMGLELEIPADIAKSIAFLLRSDSGNSRRQHESSSAVGQTNLLRKV